MLRSQVQPFVTVDAVADVHLDVEGDGEGGVALGGHGDVTCAVAQTEPPVGKRDHP